MYFELFGLHVKGMHLSLSKKKETLLAYIVRRQGVEWDFRHSVI